MKTVYLNNFMSSVVTELERNGQYSTAHVCGSVLRSVMTFDGDGLLLSGITPLWLKAYEHYLLHKGEKGLEWNTISTYMRMLRAIYNRAVVRKLGLSFLICSGKCSQGARQTIGGYWNGMICGNYWQKRIWILSLLVWSGHVHAWSLCFAFMGCPLLILPIFGSLI